MTHLKLTYTRIFKFGSTSNTPMYGSDVARPM